MTEKTTHISQQCLDLIDKLGRLATTQAFMKDGITRGSVTCTACIKVVGDTRALMQAHKNSPMSKVLAEVEASSRRPVDKRSRR